MEVLLADIVLMNEIAVLAEQVGAAADVFDQTINNTPPTSNIARKTTMSVSTTTSTATTTTTTTTTRNTTDEPITTTSDHNININDILEPQQQQEQQSGSKNSDSLATTTNATIVDIKRTESGINNEEITWASVNRTREESAGMMMNDVSDNSRRSSTSSKKNTNERDSGRRRRLSSIDHGTGYDMLEQKSSSGGLVIKNLLDQWEDPVLALSAKVREENKILVIFLLCFGILF